MRLLNVRIGPEEERVMRELRRQGVSISEIVRQAIRSEGQRRATAATVDVEALLSEMVALYPDPPQAEREPRVVATDRRAVRRLIRRKLRRRR